MGKESKLESNYDAEMAVFKKKIKHLEKYKGKHTELISLYIPFGTDRSTVMNQLSEEINQSSNIKSPTTRKNVQGALRKIIVFLKKINFNLPKKGIVIFSGNVSSVEGRSDIKLFTIQPPKDLNTKLYWCDSTFHFDPLKEMIVPDHFYALMTIDKNEATIAILSGKKYEILGHFTSTVPGKTRAGGQCLTPETQIILSNGEIKEIKNIKENDFVKGINFETGKTIDTRVLKKWETYKKTMNITTQNPRFEISCSPDHTFFVYEKGAIIEKPASELEIKENLLFNEKIQICSKEYELKREFNSYALTSNGRKILETTRKENNIYQKELAKKIKKTQTAISTIELGKRDLKIKTIQSICKALNINSKEFIEKNCIKKDSQNLPNKLTKELAQFIGYFEGDGSFENERITLFDSDKKLIEKYSKISKKIFNSELKIKHRKEKGYYQSRIYGKQIVSFLRNNFPEIKKAIDSKIPKQILNSNNKIIAAFLKGFYDAAGYSSNKGVGLGINNKQLAQQIQISLLRLGIISSFLDYDNKKNKYSNNTRYTIVITGKHSLQIFKSKIGFESKQKQEKLQKIINEKSNRDKSRQILAEGQHIKEIILENKNLLKEVYDSNMFLNGKRKISKEVFKKQIINKVNQKTKNELQKIYDYELLPTEILKINKFEKQEMIDLSVKHENFIANGLIVHNSSQRFERLREEAMQDFFKRAADKFNKIFEDKKEKLAGIIIGGPGMTKQYFIDKEVLNHELAKKILGVVDTSYTDEGGIREVVQKSEDLLKDSEMIKERSTLEHFLGEIAKEGLASYGKKEVEELIEQGRVEKLIISEDIPWLVIKKKCEHCGNEEIEIFKDPEDYDEAKVTCSKCNSKVEVLEDIDYLEYMVEKAKETGARVQVVGTETPQGKHFLEGFGGVGALLRY
jgi:peptide subunit release factor 1 (eRF1)/transcriptional regulator with XRE-family HTH domain